jgi:hypothetical protein
VKNTPEIFLKGWKQDFLGFCLGFRLLAELKMRGCQFQSYLQPKNISYTFFSCFIVLKRKNKFNVKQTKIKKPSCQVKFLSFALDGALVIFKR